MSAVVHELKEGKLEIELRAGDATAFSGVLLHGGMDLNSTVVPSFQSTLSTLGSFPSSAFPTLGSIVPPVLIAHFESAETGATYRAELDRATLGNMCPILIGAPELLAMMVDSKPALKVNARDTTAHFQMSIGKSKYVLDVIMPKYVPAAGDAGFGELSQHVNLLRRKLAKSEERIAKLEADTRLMHEFIHLLCNTFNMRYTPDNDKDRARWHELKDYFAKR